MKVQLTVLWLAHLLGVTSTVLALSKEIFVRKIVCLASLCWLSSSVATFSKLARLSQDEENELYGLMENKFGEDVWEIFSVDKKVPNLPIPALLFHDRQDCETALRKSEAIADTWHSSQLIVTKKPEHQRTFRDPQAIEQTVKFIAG